MTRSLAGQSTPHGYSAQDRLAVLCDFGDRAPEQVVGYIVRRLKELTGSMPPALPNCWI